MITNRCKCCLATDKLIKHHIAYKRYGAEKDILITLCENCHNFLHRFINGSDKDIKRFTLNFIKGNKFW